MSTQTQSFKQQELMSADNSRASLMKKETKMEPEFSASIYKKKDFDAASQSSATDSEASVDAILIPDIESKFKIESKVEAKKESKPALRKEAVVIVDPWSSGDRLCVEIAKLGFKVIILWDNNNIRSTTLPAAEVVMNVDFKKTIELFESMLDFEYNVKAVLAGSETGVLLAERLANTLRLPTNPPQLAEARRNKYLMSETLKKNGVRGVHQIITTDFGEAKAFIEEFNPTPFKIILKPNMGAGSDDVYLCKSMEEVEKCFNIVNGKQNSLGLTNDGVLVQEYLSGVEYVVDSVSKDGQHEIVSLWVYDKREVNGRFNVYYGSFPMVDDCETSRQLIEYTKQVLDALEFKNGPGHAEIKMTPTGPCLVEIGARCHGGGATWLEVAQNCWGFDQLSTLVEKSVTQMTVSLPRTFPTKFNKFGVVLDCVYYEDGVLESIPGDSAVRCLESFSSIMYYNKVGDAVVKTVDCNTAPGQVILIHEDENQVRKDYEFIHNLLATKDGFFKLKN